MKVIMISGDIHAIRGKDCPFINTLRGLIEEWDEILVFCSSVNENLSYSPFAGVTLVSMKRNLFHRLFFFHEIIYILNNKKFDLVVSHEYGLNLNGFNASIISKKLSIKWISEIFHIEGYPYLSNYKDIVYRVMMRLFIIYSKNLVLFYRIMNQGEIKLRLNYWGIDDNKIKVIPAIYIDFDIFQFKPSVRDIDLVFCGRLVPNKGIFQILRLVKSIIKNFPNIKLVLVGDGPLYPKILTFIEANQLSKNISIIQWVDRTENIADIYRRSKILICASTAEGGPRVPLEAMVCGTAIISTPVGVMPEFIDHDINGFLYDWDDESLIKHTLYLLENPNVRDKFFQNSKHHFAKLDKKLMLKKYALSYKV